MSKITKQYPSPALPLLREGGPFDSPLLRGRLSGGNYRGLSSAEAEKLLKQYGLNEPPKPKKRGVIGRALKIISEPMMLLILATAAIYYFVGDFIESLIFAGSVVPIAIMEFLQQRRTDRALEELDKLAVSSAQVYRDNKIKIIDSKYIVPGDLAHLTAGDKIPADGWLLESPGLLVDESSLTGESLAAAKGASLKKEADENKLWQGTIVTSGEGDMVISATGSATEYGRLGLLLGQIKKTKTPLQFKISRFLKIVAIGGIAAAVIAGLFLWLTRGWAAGVLGGLTIAMSLIPEEIPIVFSVFLILGVLRMSRRNALIREMVLVETLGSVTVICTDKTGTLTEGRMSLEKIYRPPHIQLKEFIEAMLLALERVAVDPIEVEAQKFARESSIEPHALYDECRLAQDKPFDSKSKSVHHLWQRKNGEFWQYSAGAPEYIIEQSAMSKKDKDKASGAYVEASERGYRVVAVARKKMKEKEKISTGGYEFVGLMLMSDPPRAEVKEAIDICQKAGIRVVMITGDNKLTAHSVADSIGLIHDEEIIDGAEIEKISPEALKERVKHCHIFARVKPEQKHNIVSALQEAGEVVAMTGDGVNDAPALKKASIGVAMGVRGTEAARQAAGMVLLDDNFSTIVKAVREGRRIFDNMRQAFLFLLTFHIPIVGLAFAPLFFGQPLIFSPIHIIFLEFICDPVSVLGFEREPARHSLMKEGPRPAGEPIIGPWHWLLALLRGGAIFLTSFGFYYYFGARLGDYELGRSATFFALVLSQSLLLLFTREWHQFKTNKVILGLALGTILFISMIIVLPTLRGLFYFVPLSLKNYGLIFGVVSLAMIFIAALTGRIKRVAYVQR
ncbi:cation-transporting P-type ATPase [Patescibacteria group bacterium]|nr:MAG: cation-transporting P-type ATPase [Patescibacteria group bacterium]